MGFNEFMLKKMLRNISFVHKIVIHSLFHLFGRTELGKKAFMYAVPSDWNLLQLKLK